MKARILEEMMFIIDTNCECKSDFYTYDLRELANESESTPFLWCVECGGTTLLQLHEAEMKENLHNEEYRYQFMQNPNADWQNFVNICEWHKNDGYIYYYDGITLEQIPFGNVCHIAKSLWQKPLEKMVDMVCQEYPNEKYDKPIDVLWTMDANKILINTFNEDEKVSLERCIKGFMKYKTRRGKVHEIAIYADGGKDFVFTEFVNGEEVLNGGFIFDGRGWRVHT